MDSHSSKMPTASIQPSSFGALKLIFCEQSHSSIGSISEFLWCTATCSMTGYPMLYGSAGTWNSKYRVYSLWIAFLTPIGLALFGMTLKYHLSWGVFALAQTLVTTGSLSVVPVAVNYICECFVLFPAEVGIVIGVYCLSFGLTISFFINPWVASVGIGWVYGMMAIFSLLPNFFFVIVLMWKGDTISKWQISAVTTS